MKGGNKMKKRIFPRVFGALTITLLLFSFGWAQSKPESKAPMITHSFAVEKGYYGYVWKVYIETEDPEGDMYKIACVVDQPGYGRYPTDWIILKPQYRKQFTGYLQWNTFSSRAQGMKEWTQIALKVSILDKAGNESNVVVFPFTFQSGENGNREPPAPFNQREIPRLGYIHIDLFNPTLMGTGRWVDN
jgi:hypothetical protein